MKRIFIISIIAISTLAPFNEAAAAEFGYASKNKRTGEVIAEKYPDLAGCNRVLAIVQSAPNDFEILDTCGDMQQKSPAQLVYYGASSGGLGCNPSLPPSDPKGCPCSADDISRGLRGCGEGTGSGVTLPQQPSEYVPLSPLPGTTEPCDPKKDPSKAGQYCTNIGTYIQGAYKLAIGLSIAVAVIMIFWGGFEYLLSQTPFGKSDGKARIQNAIGGLLLVLLAFLILQTINPNLVNFNFSLDLSKTGGSTNVPIIYDPSIPVVGDNSNTSGLGNICFRYQESSGRIMNRCENDPGVCSQRENNFRSNGNVILVSCRQV